MEIPVLSLSTADESTIHFSPLLLTTETNPARQAPRDKRSPSVQTSALEPQKSCLPSQEAHGRSWEQGRGDASHAAPGRCQAAPPGTPHLSELRLVRLYKGFTALSLTGRTKMFHLVFQIQDDCLSPPLLTSTPGVLGFEPHEKP